MSVFLRSHSLYNDKKKGNKKNEKNKKKSEYKLTHIHYISFCIRKGQEERKIVCTIQISFGFRRRHNRGSYRTDRYNKKWEKKILNIRTKRQQNKTWKKKKRRKKMKQRANKTITPFNFSFITQVHLCLSATPNEILFVFSFLSLFFIQLKIA